MPGNEIGGRYSARNSSKIHLDKKYHHLTQRSFTRMKYFLFICFDLCFALALSVPDEILLLKFSKICFTSTVVCLLSEFLKLFLNLLFSQTKYV